MMNFNNFKIKDASYEAGDTVIYYHANFQVRGNDVYDRPPPEDK